MTAEAAALDCKSRRRNKAALGKAVVVPQGVYRFKFNGEAQDDNQA